MAGADIAHDRGINLCTGMAFAKRQRPMLTPVVLILLRGHPPKVLKPIVRSITIAVAAFGSLRRISDECDQDEPMDGQSLAARAVAKQYAVIPIWRSRCPDQTRNVQEPRAACRDGTFSQV